nr:FCS-Like Zinc finger 5-like isoform X2 [Nicotiana tomentosiformis]
MMLGKRGRPPMRRTTSMTGITVDIGTGTGSEQEPSDYRPKVIVDHHDQFKGSSEKQVMMSSTTAGGYDHQYFMAAMVSPRYQRRISGEGFQTETANFLRTCGLCNRRLAPGRDIYMYRRGINIFPLHKEDRCPFISQQRQLFQKQTTLQKMKEPLDNDNHKRTRIVTCLFS